MSVLIDACALVPEWLRDLLLRAAEAELFHLRWSNTVLDEVERTLVTDLGVPASRSARLRSALTEAFDDGEITGFESLIDTMTNDPKDRHVLAAAAHVAREEGTPVVVVTANVRDFPRASWPEGIEVKSPDAFLSELLEHHAVTLVDILWAHARRRKKPPVAVEELINGLARNVPKFIERIRLIIHVRNDQQLDEIHARAKRAQGDELEVALRDVELVDRPLADQR